MSSDNGSKKKTSTKNKPNQTTIVCEYCKTICDNKTKLKIHEKSCSVRRTCKWCNIVFKNRGNLVTHVFHIHGDKSSKNDESQEIICKICNKTFKDYQYYRYHIRSVHYNMNAKTPLFHKKKVNDVWYERVLKTDIIVELHKTKPNALLIKRYSGKDDVVIEDNPEVENLSHLYPTKQRNQKMKCEVCGIMILKRVYKKHYDEKHSDFTKHQCNNCKATFKRSYLFTRHVCHKEQLRKKKGAVVKKESLKPILI